MNFYKYISIIFCIEYCLCKLLIKKQLDISIHEQTRNYACAPSTAMAVLLYLNTESSIICNEQSIHECVTRDRYSINSNGMENNIAEQLNLMRTEQNVSAEKLTNFLNEKIFKQGKFTKLYKYRLLHQSRASISQKIEKYEPLPTRITFQKYSKNELNLINLFIFKTPKEIIYNTKQEFITEFYKGIDYDYDNDKFLDFYRIVHNSLLFNMPVIFGFTGSHTKHEEIHSHFVIIDGIIVNQQSDKFDQSFNVQFIVKDPSHRYPMIIQREELNSLLQANLGSLIYYDPDIIINNNDIIEYQSGILINKNIDINFDKNNYKDDFYQDNIPIINADDIFSYK